MIDPGSAERVIVAHQYLTSVSDREISEAVGRETFGPRTRLIRIGTRVVAFDDLHELDWGREQDALLRDIEAQLLPLLRAGAGEVHYFGMLPIPLAVEIGSRLGPARRVLAHQQRHEPPRSWRWPSDAHTVRVNLHGVPSTECLAKGDLVLRVSCSHRVSPDDVHAIVPHPLGDLHVEVENTHEEVLQSENDVTAVALEFGRALDCVRRFFPNCETIHLFAAVPPALAIRLGTEMNPTIHRPVQTYQFSSRARPRYVRAVLVGERSRIELTAEERVEAHRGREAFARSLSQVQTLAGLEHVEKGWLEALLGPAATELPAALRRLGPIGGNSALVGATVMMDEHDAGGEFRWDSESRGWIFDDRLLAALVLRLDGGRLEQAGRLFLLHEAIHLARQGVSSATAEGIGRLPRVLEEVDYLADVWALLHEYARAVRASEVDEASAADFFRKLLRAMTATFWAFDAGDLPLRAIQIRRLNRYLIWYWQRLALERASTLVDVFRVLAEKPVLEISGPRVLASRGRVMFDLDPTCFDSVELGVLSDGFRVARIGNRAGARVTALLDAVRLGKEDDFLGALRGVFDSAQAID